MPSKQLESPKQPEELLEKIEENEALPPQDMSELRAIVMSGEYKGPIPPASELSKYEKILPGSAKDIIGTMLKEQKFRHKITQESLKIESDEIRRGQLFGFILLLSFLAGSMWCVYVNQPIVAGIMLSSVVIGVVGKFIPKLISRS